MCFCTIKINPNPTNAATTNNAHKPGFTKSCDVPPFEPALDNDVVSKVKSNNSSVSGEDVGEVLGILVVGLAVGIARVGSWDGSRVGTLGLAVGEVLGWLDVGWNVGIIVMG